MKHTGDIIAIVVLIIATILISYVLENIVWGIFTLLVGAFLYFSGNAFAQAYVPCCNCKGSGMITKKRWIRIIRLLGYMLGGFGKHKCPHCNGVGLVPILGEISNKNIIKLNQKYKKAFGKDYPPFAKYIKETT